MEDGSRWAGRLSWTWDACSMVVRTAGAGLRRLAEVAVMQATDFGNLHDPARLGELDGPEVRRILVEREMRASPVIVGEVAGQNAAQMPLAKDDDMLQALASHRANESLREGILPRAVRGREDFLDPHALHSVPKLFAVDLVAVAQEIGGRGVVRKGIHDLLGGPVGGGMLGHVEVDDAPAVVSEHDKNKEDAQARGGHREEIEGDQIADMVGEERPPGLRRQGAPLRYEPRDGALGDVEPQPEKFPVNSRGAPQRIGRRHPCDESLDLNIDGWAARDGPGGELGPVLAEAAPLPPQDGVGRHDDESLPPARPHPRQRAPEEAVAPAHLRPSHRPLVDGELVAQGQVLQGDMAVSAAEEGKQSKQAEQEGDHRAGIFSGSTPPDQSLGAGRGFGEGQQARRIGWGGASRTMVTRAPISK